MSYQITPEMLITRLDALIEAKLALRNKEAAKVPQPERFINFMDSEIDLLEEILVHLKNRDHITAVSMAKWKKDNAEDIWQQGFASCQCGRSIKQW